MFILIIILLFVVPMASLILMEYINVKCHDALSINLAILGCLMLWLTYRAFNG